MGAITIHDLDPQLNARLTQEAQRQGTSKNALIKALLAKAMGLPVNGAYADDYGEFAGLWTAEEQREFAATQQQNQAVDAADWQ